MAAEVGASGSKRSRQEFELVAGAASATTESYKTVHAAAEKREETSVEAPDVKVSGMRGNIDSVACKLALIVRADLGMGKGKMCAQCSHAAIGAYRIASGLDRSGVSTQKAAKKLLDDWEMFGQTTVTVKVNSEAELLELKRKAATKGINHYMVRDAGRTQVEAGSLTVLAIGPDRCHAIDEITGHLKLL